MAESDVRVLGTATEFRDVRLDSAFNLAGGAVSGFTVAYVTLEVTDRRGRRGRGRGASILSVPWSWPRSASSVSSRDARLRWLVKSLATRSTELEAGDPLVLCRQLATAAEAQRVEDEGGEPMPALAAALALGAVDNALHDAWARTANKPVFAMYTAAHLDADLGAFLGSDFRGRWPGDFVTAPRTRLPVQHVVGVGDPLTADRDAGAIVRDGPNRQRTLEDWAQSDRFRDVKLKLSGAGAEVDAQRVVDVHRTMEAQVGAPVRLALDPNESYPDLAAVLELIGHLRRISPEAHESVAYMEQPVPRDHIPDPDVLKEIGAHVPVLVDEGLARVDDLADLAAQGWHGLVVKAAKGQTSALLCHAFARQHGMFVTIQDLTAPDLALEHSARLAAHLDLSLPAFECNSRQYAPGANSRLVSQRPELVTVVDGEITVGEEGPGLR